MEQRTCPHCGTANAPNASTCSWCGRSVVEDPDATQPLGPPVTPGDQPWTQAEPRQPAADSWEPPTQPQQPAASSWEPGAPQQPPGGDWGQPTAPQQPAGDWRQPQQQAWGQGHAAPGGYQQDAPPGEQPAWGAQAGPGPAQWGSGAPPEPRKRNPLPLVALAGALVIVLGVGAYFLLQRGGSDDPLQAPASVGGLNRVDSGALRASLDQQAKLARQQGAKNFVMAAYGSEVQPQFVLVAMRESSDKTRQDFIRQFDQAFGQLASLSGGGQNQTFKQDGVDYRCSSPRAGTPVSICHFDDGDLVGFGVGTSQAAAAQRVSQLTADARNQMT